MAGGVLADQKHFKLESQRSLEAAATEKHHRRAVVCRRIAVITILIIVISFIVLILGGIVYSKVSAEHNENMKRDALYAPAPQSTRGMRGGSSVTGHALATIRDLQQLHGGSLTTLRSLRAVAFELEGVPQLKTVNRIERSGETYTLYFDKGTLGEQLSFTASTFVFIDAKGKSHLLSPSNNRLRT